MFNKKVNALEKEVAEIKREIFCQPKEEDKEEPYTSIFDRYLFGHFLDWTKETLYERVGQLEKDFKDFKKEIWEEMNKQNHAASHRIELLYKHFNLERVKITEENGSVHVTEKLRAKKKEKKSS